MLFDFDTIPAQDRYKLLISTVVPRPIAWVVSQDPEGRLNAAPFSFFNALVGDPPVVGIGIGGRRPEDVPGTWKDTGANIRATGQFVVNLVGYDNREAMNVTAIELPHDINELHQAGLTTLPSAKVAPPRIAESPVALECERLAIIDIATDRAIVLGRVVAVHVHDDCVLDAARCYIDTPKLDLIGRMHGAGWYARTTDRFELPRIPVGNWALRD
jgi:flavin reductase (DIM6/NTAB) family NADH-FMN oxidoreductase RutF